MSYFGTCLVNGKHRPGAPEARECPVLNGRITPEENVRRAGTPKSYTPPGASELTRTGGDSGSPETASSAPAISGGSKDSFRGQRNLGGRPRTYKDAQEREREKKRRQRSRVR